MIDINAHSKKMFDDSGTVGIPYYEGTKLSQLRLYRFYIRANSYAR